MEQKDYDYLDFGSPPLRREGRGRSGWGVPVLAGVVGVICVGLCFFAAKTLLGGHATAQDNVGSISPDDLEKRQMAAFVEDFLPAYYGFSYAFYDQSVSKAESMMTPEFQAAYDQRAEDLDFKRRLSALRVVTDGIRILPGSMEFARQGPMFYVRLAGTMTYTTGINGARGDFPLALLVSLKKGGDGFLVDNVERLR